MKRVLLTLALATIASGVFAQGRVNFANAGSPAGSLIYTNGVPLGGAVGPIFQPGGGVPTVYRFELFAAPDGTTDPTLFTGTGITNASSSLLGAGRISSRASVDPLRGAVGDIIQVQVRGWSANLGNTWAEATANALAGTFTGIGWISDPANLAHTPIGRVALASTTVNGPTIFLSSIAPPAGTVQIANMMLDPVPEPSTIALGLMGIGATLVLIRRRK